MSIIGLPERATQNRVIALFRDGMMQKLLTGDSPDMTISQTAIANLYQFIAMYKHKML